ncbi:MAG: Maf family nucleotide pyrophosphatase [Paracoccaceae bacterium]
MTLPIILASGSKIRHALLKNAGVLLSTMPARVDESAIRQAMQKDRAIPRDIADTLAESKARKVSDRNPDALVIGCDQVLDFKGNILEKARDPKNALEILQRLAGQQHCLYSAAVIYQGGRPQWRHIGKVKVSMRHTSAGYLQDYVDRNWESIKFSVGCYHLEEEGARLISSVEGDYFTVLGLPLIEVLHYLTKTGALPG